MFAARAPRGRGSGQRSASRPGSRPPAVRQLGAHSLLGAYGQQVAPSAAVIPPVGATTSPAHCPPPARTSARRATSTAPRRAPAPLVPAGREFSARAATAPARPAGGTWNWANTRLPAPRQVSARVQIQAAGPLLSGSGCWATARRSPCAPRASGPWAAAGGPRPALRAGASSTSWVGGPPGVRRAGSQLAEVGEQTRPAGVAQLERLPGRALVGQAGLTTGSVTPSWSRRSGRAPAPGVSRSRTAACAPRAPSDSGRCRRSGPRPAHPERVGAVHPREVERGARLPSPARRTGRPADRRRAAPRCALSTVPAYSSWGAPIGGRRTGCRGSPRPGRLAGAGPDGERAPQQRRVAGEVAAGRPDGEVGTGGGPPTRWARPGAAWPGRGRPRRPGSARTPGRRRRRAPSRRPAGRAAPRTPRGRRRRRARPWPCCLRRIRSVGRAWSEQGSNSAESSSPACCSMVVGLARGRVRGSAQPAAVEHPRDTSSSRAFEAAQHVGRAGGPGQGGQALVQGEFVGAARAREQPQAPDLGQQRGQLGPLGPGRAPQRQPRLQRRAHHPAPDKAYPGSPSRPAAARRDQRVGRAGPPGRAAARAARWRARSPPGGCGRARRQHQIGEPDQPRVVLDERGLGLLDVDGGGGGWGISCLGPRSAKRANVEMVTPGPQRADPQAS